MSIDVLQEKIRKTKNPTVLEMSLPLEALPSQYTRDGAGYAQFCECLLEGMRGLIPAVRLSFGAFSLLGHDGLYQLSQTLNKAAELGYYVLLDVPEFSSVAASALAAEVFSGLPADGLVCFEFCGEDAVKPYISPCKAAGKSLFVNIRTPNKSAAQLQDLMTGSRLVHMAAADIAARLGEALVGKSGYSLVAGVCAANAADSLKSLRGKHKKMFLLVDGYDYTNANAKNCSAAFDSLGHGAIVCAGSSVTAAWCDETVDPRNYLESTLRAAERMRKNITRYITVL